MSTQSNPSLPSSKPDGETRAAEQGRLRLLVNIICLAITWACWLGLALNDSTSPEMLAVLAIGGALVVLPLVYFGRWMLDRCGEPCPHSVQRAEWITTAIHYLVGICLGMAVIAAVQLAQLSLSGDLFQGQLANILGILLMVIGGVCLVLVVINLLVKGLGLPFALSLTQIVASDWMYAWTRNPMVLSALAFLIGLGLWLQSVLFIIWVLIVVSPVFMVFLQVYEERELEIRFGGSYLAYKARTPRFWPRKPQN